MCLNKNTFDLLLISFVFYTHNCLEKQTTNSGVLLNCQMRGFVFSNYQSLNNWSFLLESGKILKQKWHYTTKNGMLKLTYIKVLWKYLSSIASTACHFRALKCYANLNLTIRFGFNLRFKKWFLDFALSKAQARIVRKINNWNLHHNWINLPSGNWALETSCFEKVNQLLLRVE